MLKVLKWVYHTLKWMWSILLASENAKIEMMHRIYGQKETDGAKKPEVCSDKRPS